MTLQLLTGPSLMEEDVVATATVVQFILRLFTFRLEYMSSVLLSFSSITLRLLVMYECTLMGRIDSEFAA